MKCREARCYLSPYIDSELDATRTFEISRHLEGCPPCARIFGEEAELELAISERLRRSRGDEEQVFKRVLARAVPGRGRSMGVRLLLAAASLLVLLGLFTYRLTAGGSEAVPEIIAMVAEDHRLYILGEIQPELLTDDPVAVASFLQGQLGEETGALPTGDGWEVEGARVCGFRDMRVGFVTLRYHGIPVSVVDAPHEEGEHATAHEIGLKADERCFELTGGRGIVRRTPSGFRAAFGDIAVARLREVIAAAR